MAVNPGRNKICKAPEGRAYEIFTVGEKILIKFFDTPFVHTIDFSKTPAPKVSEIPFLHKFF